MIHSRSLSRPLSACTARDGWGYRHSMMPLGFGLLVWSACLILTMQPTQAQAGDRSADRPLASGELRVVELFTSHGCSSCPPADALLGKLIDERADVIALEWHVDYWDTLVHGSDGSWADPFAQPAYSARQRTYNNQPLRGRRGVYTPQAVINGQFAAVGSDAVQIEAALAEPPQPAVSLSVSRAGSALDIVLQGAPGAEKPLPRADIWLVHYLQSVTTDITAGENRHRQLTNHHVVTDVQPVGSTRDARLAWQVAFEPRDGYGCAVLVQGAAQSPILGAARCP